MTSTSIDDNTINQSLGGSEHAAYLEVRSSCSSTGTALDKQPHGTQRHEFCGFVLPSAEILGSLQMISYSLKSTSLSHPVLCDKEQRTSVRFEVYQHDTFQICSDQSSKEGSAKDRDVKVQMHLREFVSGWKSSDRLMMMVRLSH